MRRSASLLGEAVQDEVEEHKSGSKVEALKRQHAEIVSQLKKANTEYVTANQKQTHAEKVNASL